MMPPTALRALGVGDHAASSVSSVALLPVQRAQLLAAAARGARSAARRGSCAWS